MPSFRELTGNLKVCEDLTTHIAKSGTLCVDGENHQIILHDGVTPGGIVLQHGGSADFLPLTGGTLSGALFLAEGVTIMPYGEADDLLKAVTRGYVDTQIADATSTTTGAASQLVYYSARTTNTDETDPGKAKIEWNTITQSDATELYVSKISSLGNDLTIIWNNSIGARIAIQRKNDASVVARYTLNSIDDHDTWLTLNVTPISSSGLPFSNQADLLVAIVRDAAYLALSAGPQTLTGPVTFATVGFNTTAPIAKPTITGSRGSNAALTSLLAALASYGLIINSTT